MSDWALKLADQQKKADQQRRDVELQLSEQRRYARDHFYIVWTDLFARIKSDVELYNQQRGHNVLEYAGDKDHSLKVWRLVSPAASLLIKPNNPYFEYVRTSGGSAVNPGTATPGMLELSAKGNDLYFFDQRGPRQFAVAEEVSQYLLGPVCSAVA